MIKVFQDWTKYSFFCYSKYGHPSSDQSICVGMAQFYKMSMQRGKNRKQAKKKQSKQYFNLFPVHNYAIFYNGVILNPNEIYSSLIQI